MRILLDTHVFLWWLKDSPKLPKVYRTVLADGEHAVYVSAASIWEIAIKASIGKLKLNESVKLESVISDCGFEELPITSSHAAAIRTLPNHHADPFDRLLLAQAQLESLTIATQDAAFEPYGISLLPD